MFLLTLSILALLGSSTYRKIVQADETASENLKELQIILEKSDRGTSESGNVLIYKDNKLWSICDDNWNINSAHVACRLLGFVGASNAHANSFFGATHYEIGLDNVVCTGLEDHLISCQHAIFGKHNCNKREAAGVTCSNNIPTSTKKPTRPTYNRESFTVPNDFSGNSVYKEPYAIRLQNGRNDKEGRVEVKVEGGEWGVVCGDGWSLLEAMVVCRQLGLNYSLSALKTSFFGGDNMAKIFNQIRCDGDEANLTECYHGQMLERVSCSKANRVAGVMCVERLPDLVPNATLIEKSAYLHDQSMYHLQCAMEENCAAPSAFEIKNTKSDWHVHRRRLLRFSSSTWNFGTADFKPILRKQDWEWHLCHMHYHSMQVFASYDVLDAYGNKKAEGHKASFCLEDVECVPNVTKKYACKGYGDQGISIGCADNYLHDIDCQWVDMTDVPPGYYIFKVHINPEFKIAELDFSNNAVTCVLYYSGSSVNLNSCKLGRG
ncbi:hypothetical protein HELRODRAFT_73641 [Helobdella robusta]|uniref:SRCR domain-containing protein n=1 Tax=Helobdella robusta TaxID=6412 RepID=T1G1G7_HELRO|nr:hypothetical protein HELRODRAFT_73641 [Helobdella robusta]ESO09287.1 hypothetical protein HELRODRAFT_73641 [Helobdella robusta]